MFKRLYRQRRRFIVFWALIGVACWITYSGNHDVRFWMKHELAGPEWLVLLSMGLAIFILATCVAILVVVLVPAFRRGLEVGAATIVLVELLKLGSDAVPVFLGLETYGWAWFIGIFYILDLALSHDFGRKLGLRRTLDVTRVRVMDASSQAVWTAMMPEADAVDRHWNRGLMKVAPRPDLGAHQFEVHYRLGKFGTLVQRQTREAWNRPFSGAYAFEPDDPARAKAGHSGRMSLNCSTLESGQCKVEVHQRFDGLGLGTWLLLVLDDHLASELDGVAAYLRGRRDWSVSGWQVRKMARV